MNSDDNWLVHDHSLYEDILFKCQDLVEAGEWNDARQSFDDLVRHLKNHMAMEEEVLYPAYEKRVTSSTGPTQALREDHDQLVQLVRDMIHVFRSRDAGHVLDCLSHLEEKMIKHHEKEEDIFLPMASVILDTSREEITRQLNSFDASKARRKWNI